MTYNNCVPDVYIEMGDYKFLSSPIVLGDSDIDLILGMDWLSKHKAERSWMSPRGGGVKRRFKIFTVEA